MATDSGEPRTGGKEEDHRDRGDQSAPTSAWDDSGVLEITWDDLADLDGPEAGAATPQSKHYPRVDDSMLEKQKASGEVQTYVVCSHTGRPFYVFWEESEPGVYNVSRVEAYVEERAQPTGGLTEIQGTFLLAQFPGCPHCGSPRMSVCEMCQTTSCEGAARSSWLGKRTLQCPNCGNRGELHGQAGSAYGEAGGKGKKGK